MFAKIYKCGLVLLISILLFCASWNEANADQKAFIVVFDKSVNEIQKEAVIKKFDGIIAKDLKIINGKAIILDEAKALDFSKAPGVIRLTADDFIKLDSPMKQKIVVQATQVVPWGVEATGAESLGKIVITKVDVAIMDTGIDLEHPDLKENIAGGINIVDPSVQPVDIDGHGTQVAGIVAGVNNKTGVLGVAPKASLYPVCVFRKSGNSAPIAFYSDIIAGLEWCAANRMKVVNISFGSYVDDPNIREAVAKAISAGVVIVASAGNNGSSNPFFPASYPDVISVSAVDIKGIVANWSNFGPDIDLAAPGVDILTTSSQGKYIELSGTDFSAPHVTGAMALALAVNIKPQKAIEILFDKAQDVGNSGKDDYYGYGMVDAKKTAYSAWWQIPLKVNAKAAPIVGNLPLTVSFSGEVLSGPPTKPVFYKWDFDNNKINDFTNVISAETAYMYTHPGVYIAILQVTDFLGKTATDFVTIVVKLPYSVDLIADPEKGYTPLSVDFQANLTGNAIVKSYDWDFDGDGTYEYSSGKTPSATYVYETEGIYQPMVKLTDVFGNFVTDFTEVNVKPPLNVEAYADPDTGEAPLDVNLSATITGGSGTIVLIEWDFESDGIIDYTDGVDALHTYPVEGLYSATIKVTDDWGGTASDSVEITVINPFKLSLSADPTQTHTLDDVTFTAIPTNGALPISYEWDFDGDGVFDQSSGDSPVIKHAYSASGVYDVTVKGVDANNRNATASVQVEVATPVTVSLSADPLIAYTFMDILFTANPNGGIPPISYDWDFNNDGVYETSSGNSATIAHSFENEGTYTIGVKATDSVSSPRGIATSSVRVTVVRTIEVTLKSSLARAHTGDNIRFEATASNGSPPINYYWDFDGNGVFETTSGTDNFIDYAYELPGNYVPQVKAADSIGFAIAESSANIALPLVIDLTADPIKVDNGQNVTFEAVTTGGFEPIKYEWDFDNDGTVDYRSDSRDYTFPEEVIPFADHAYPKGGIYTCVVKAVDDIDGPKGTATDSVQVTVVEPLRAYLHASSAANRVNDEFTFTVDVTGGVPPFTFEWDLDGIEGYEYSSGSNPMAKYVYNKVGTYWPVVKVTDSLGETKTDTVRVIVANAMTARFYDPTPNAKFHVNCDTYFGLSIQNAYAPVKYEWDFNGDSIIDITKVIDSPWGPSLYYKFTTPGLYNATVKVTDAKGGNGGTAIASVPIEIVPPLEVSITAEPTEGVIPVEIQFTAHAKNIIETPDYKTYFSWDLDGNGGIDTITGAVPTAKRTYTTTGVRKITVRLMDNKACEYAYASTWINVYDSPADYVFMKKWGKCSQYFSDFENPFGMAVDQKGYIYVAEYGRDFIGRFGPQGYYTAVWYNKDNQPKQFFDPIDVAVDSQGRIFVLNTGYHHVSIYDYKGNFIKKWDTPQVGVMSIEIDGSDNVYIGIGTSSIDKCIQKFDTDGNLLAGWGKNGGADGDIIYPTGIAVDSLGNVYVADDAASKVQKFDKNGSFIKKFGEADADYGRPYDVTLDKDGNIFVSYAYGVKKFDSNCNFITKFGGKGSADGQFNGARGIAVDDLGYVYVMDKGNCRIQKFRKGPIVLPPLTVKAKADRASIKVGDPVNFTADYTGTPINFNWKFDQGAKPIIDSDNYVTPDLKYEPLNSCYDIKATLTIRDDFGREISDSITVTVTNDKPYNFVKKWGSEGTDDGQFSGYSDGLPGIAVSKSGYVYVTDLRNHRVQKFDSNGNFMLKWGGFGTDSGKFSFPRGIAVDGFGNVFVTDPGNDRIQKFDPDGIFVKQWVFTKDDPLFVTVDKFGKVYVVTVIYGTDYFIQKFDNDGNFIKKWAIEYTNDVAVDSFGNVYVATNDYDRIYKYDSEGNLIKKWGTSGPDYDYGLGAYYGLSWAHGIAIDKSDRVYIVDTSNYRVVVYDSDGNFITFFGCYGNQDGHFTRPMDIAVDSSGFAYVTDCGLPDYTDDTRIQKFASPIAPPTPECSDYTFYKKWGTQGNGNNQLNEPFDVTVDSADYVYVVDMANDRIVKFDANGNYLLQWGSNGIGNGKFDSPKSIAVFGTNDVFVVDSFNNRIQVFDTSGGFKRTWGIKGTGNGQFTLPNSIAVDSKGNLYVTDYFNNRVQKFDFSGTYLLQWGSIGNGNKQFSNPAGIAIDPFDNVYVVDVNNKRIQKFDSNGNYLLQWGTGGTGIGQFQYPTDIAVDKLGDVYVTDYISNRVQKFSPNGIFITQWGTFGALDGQFDGPQGICVDDLGYIYVADMLNYRIQVFACKGITPPPSNCNYTLYKKWGTQGSGNDQLNFPFDVTVDDADHVYVADTSNDRIVKFDANGTYLLKWGSNGKGNGKFDGPRSIAVFGNDVFVVDGYNDRIQVFDASGGFKKEWGIQGSGNGQFDLPNSIAVDSIGNLYVTDYYNNRVQKFNLSGTYLLQWGSTGNGNKQFEGPVGIAVDPSDNVYVADSNNKRIQKFDKNGNYLLQWGTEGTGDGQFKNPADIAVDKFGDVYVTDALNNRIQKFSSSGIFITQWGNNNTMNAPEGIYVDDLGYVYVADLLNSRIQKFACNAIVPVAPPIVALDKRAEQPIMPEKTALLQNYPNPFNPETWIPYQLKEDSEVNITIYNSAGQLIRRLELGYKPAGIYATQSRAGYWDGTNEFGERVSSGVYFYNIQAGKYVATKKMIILQ